MKGDVMVSTGILTIEIAIRGLVTASSKANPYKETTTIIDNSLRLNSI